jgi:hypothetical protein
VGQRGVDREVYPSLEELDHVGVGVQQPQAASEPFFVACVVVPRVCRHDAAGRFPTAAGLGPGNLA